LILGLGLAFLLEIMKAASNIGAPVPVQNTVTAPTLSVAPVPHASTAPATPYAPASPPMMAATAGDRPSPSAAPRMAEASVFPTVPREMLPALCQIPSVPDDDTAILRAFEIIATPNGAYASSMRQVVNWAGAIRQSLGVSSIAIGSMAGSARESATAAMTLARGVGLQSQRVIVVDAARPGQQIDPVAGLSPGPGLAEMLVGDSKFAELITTDGASAVHILRAGHSIEFAAQYFSTNRMDAILKTLEASYDAVIINLGNLDQNTRGLARFAQAAAILSAQGNSAEVSMFAEELRHAGLRAVQHVRIAADPVRPGASAGPQPVMA
jgi:Mrp family chromosome partitioning ATPase